MEKVEGFSITCEEHEELISSLRDWRTRSGINAPKIEVRFEDLSVETEVHASRRVLPTLPNAIINTVQVLGLHECANIIIGDQMRRGISGGQKKRVTIGEMLVGLAQCFFMDDISTGLDSSTTFQILKFLQQLTRALDFTMVISLLQPAQEAFELFDDIILLCEGQIAYQGPREHVLKHFEWMGFKCPDRKNAADFLMFSQVH